MVILLILADDDGPVHPRGLESVDAANGVQYQLIRIYDQYFYKIVADGIAAADAQSRARHTLCQMPSKCQLALYRACSGSIYCAIVMAHLVAECLEPGDTDL